MVVAGLVAGVSACGGNQPAAVPDPFLGPAVCSSAIVLDPDEQPSEQMAPGRACISCHSQENAAAGEEDAPAFAFAGTAYPTGHEPDNCVGSATAGAVIEVTDSRGVVLTAEVNEGGNFFSEDDDFKPPYTALIRFQGKTRVMLDAQIDGDCNGCHTPEGANSGSDRAAQKAPGRVLLPDVVPVR